MTTQTLQLNDDSIPLILATAILWNDLGLLRECAEAQTNENVARGFKRIKSILKVEELGWLEELRGNLEE